MSCHNEVVYDARHEFSGVTKNHNQMAEIYQLPENGGSASNQVPAWLPFVSNGGNGPLSNNGWGGGILGFLIGLMFGNGGFGGGFFGGGNGNANTAFLTNTQDLLMQAVNGNGERNASAVQQLATTLGQDFNLVNSGVQAIQGTLSNLGISLQQAINAVQSGDASIIAAFQQCCCQNQLENARNTAAIQNGINGVQQSIAAQSAADTLAVCQQTNTLQNGANANTQAILSKLDAMQTQALMDKLDSARAENVRLAGELSQTQQNATIAAMIGNAVNPIAGQLAGIRSEVDAIKRCQPATITLPNNSMTAVPSIWANAVADNFVDKVSSALASAGTTTGGTTTT